MKTEPGVFSFEDLLEAPGKTTSWEGVRNYQARNLMRDELKVGDGVLIYHSNIDEPAAVGLAEVVKEGYSDHHALNPKSRYYDADAKKKGESPWVMVDVKGKAAFKTPVTRAMMQAEKGLQKMMVLKRGARLSVQPVTAEEFRIVCRLGGITR